MVALYTCAVQGGTAQAQHYAYGLGSLCPLRKLEKQALFNIITSMGKRWEVAGAGVAKYWISRSWDMVMIAIGRWND